MIPIFTPYSAGMEMTIDIPEDFRYILFEKTDRKQNIARFYYLAWQATLLDTGAVVRLYGRKGGWQRMLAPLPFASLRDARPMLNALIKRRLKRGYRVMSTA